MFKYRTKVKMTKVGAVEDTNIKTPEWEEYKMGEDNPGYSVPVQYWVTGRLIQDMAFDHGVMILRDTRNGVEVDGIMRTSPIVRMTKKTDKILELETENSVYLIEELEDQNESS